MKQSYFLQDFYVYDLSGNEMTARDIKKAHEMNLIVRGNKMAGEFYIVGSWNAIFSYLYDYIGVEIVNDYLYPLAKVLTLID